MSFISGDYNDSDIVNIPNQNNNDDISDLHHLSSRAHIILIPDTEKLSNIKREIDLIIEAYDYSKTSKLKCMLKKYEKNLKNFRIELSKLARKYEQHMQNVSFSGKALIYFKDLEDVNCLYEMNKLGKRFLRNIQNFGKGPKIFQSDIALSRKSFLIDNKDFQFHNMKVNYKKRYLTKLVLYIVIIVIFIFISTPNAILQSAAELMRKERLQKLGWSIDPEDAKLWSQFWVNIVPLLTLGINALLLILIDYFAYWQHFSTHSACQKFIFKHSFIYMLINMLVIPGLSLSTANSIYKAIKKRNFQVMTLLYSLKDKENDSFFSTLIIQSGIVGFLICLFFFSDIFNHRGILSLTINRRKNINNGNPYNSKKTTEKQKSKHSNTATTSQTTASSSSSSQYSAYTSLFSTSPASST